MSEFLRGGLELREFVRGDADENTDVAGFPGGRRQLGRVGECFRRSEQEHAVLRIQRGSFSGRNPEKLMVERGRILDESSPFRNGPSRGVRILVVEFGNAPAVGGHLSHGIDAVHHQPPERLRIVGSAGKAATDSRDRDGLERVHENRPF